MSNSDEDGAALPGSYVLIKACGPSDGTDELSIGTITFAEGEISSLGPLGWWTGKGTISLHRVVRSTVDGQRQEAKQVTSIDAGTMGYDLQGPHFVDHVSLLSSLVCYVVMSLVSSLAN